jgi:Na+/proline symporter
MEALLLILVLLASAATIAVLLLVLGALFPESIADVRRTADAMPGRSFGVGVVNFLFLGALIAAFGALSNGGGGQLAGLLAGIFLVVLVVLVAFGLAGVASLVGRRLFPERDPRGADARGAGLLSAACIAPFVGWFGLLPYVGLLGLGSFLLGRLLSWRASAPLEPATPPTYAPDGPSTEG